MLDRPSALPEAELASSWQAVAARLAIYDGLVLAVSGGPDSLAMLHGVAALKAAGTVVADINVLTVDHGLRAQSAKEAAFVSDICKKLGLFHRTVQLPEKPDRTNIQAWARDQRYRALAEDARAWKTCTKVAVLTAHTADDQAETVLMRAARGAGSEALAAIRPEADIAGVRVVRPFLGWRRGQLHHALPLDLRPIVDPSNADVRFTRVRYRNWLAEAPEPDSARSVAHGFAETARIARLESDALDHEAARLFHALGGNEKGYVAGWVALDEVPLAIAARFVRRVMLTVSRASDAAQRLDMARMVGVVERTQSGGRGKCVLAGAVLEWSAGKGGLDLMAYAEAGRSGFPQIEVAAGCSAIWDGRFEVVNSSESPCTVRAWRSGDPIPTGFDAPSRVLASLPIAVAGGFVVGGLNGEQTDIALRVVR